jgi:hypothetical protein
MLVPTPISVWFDAVQKLIFRFRSRRALTLVVFGVLGNSLSLVAQDAADSPATDRETIQILLRRIDQLEARVAKLESGRVPAETPAEGLAESPARAAAQTAPPPEAAQAQPEPSEPARMDMNKTLMSIRGFGDITFHGDNHRGDTTSFTLGQLDLFVTSDVSEKFRFLSEIVFEAGKDNVFGVDVERLLLQYSHNDYFNISAGRYHTAIGYYNTAYHHSTWLQTATGRPFLFQFEDGGGILPVHNVGVTASGLIPSGRLGLHYVAEVGNGRASSFYAEAVQNVVDENNGKSVNVALFARPQAIRGLQVGASVYHDHLYRLPEINIGQTIFSAHAVMVRPNFEWLNEVLLIRHEQQGLSHIFETPGFYTQISKPFGPYRPYFRYQYVNASDAEPVFPQVGLQQGPSVGLRFDASESVALKLQYDRTAYRHQASVNGLALQLGFTF